MKVRVYSDFSFPANWKKESKKEVNEPILSVQAPGASLMTRPVTPTTIIKQGSAVHTTVTATTTLQRPPVVQVMSPCLQDIFTFSLQAILYTTAKCTLQMNLVKQSNESAHLTLSTTRILWGRNHVYFIQNYHLLTSVKNIAVLVKVKAIFFLSQIRTEIYKE